LNAEVSVSKDMTIMNNKLQKRGSNHGYYSCISLDIMRGRKKERKKERMKKERKKSSCSPNSRFLEYQHYH